MNKTYIETIPDYVIPDNAHPDTNTIAYTVGKIEEDNTLVVAYWNKKDAEARSSDGQDIYQILLPKGTSFVLVNIQEETENGTGKNLDGIIILNSSDIRDCKEFYLHE